MGTVMTFGDLLAACRGWRQEGERVVFTNGHFDLLHLGHVTYLQAARALGDRLVVGVNSDAATRQRKGPQRPIVPERERVALVAALQVVDAALVFQGTTALELISALQPDIYVKGGDWDPSQGHRPPPEAEAVMAYGGQVVYLPLVPDRSTTSLIARIVERYRE